MLLLVTKIAGGGEVLPQRAQSQRRRKKTVVRSQWSESSLPPSLYKLRRDKPTP